MPRLEPWERQPNESTPAYAAFCEYRDMGDERGQWAVAKKVAKNRQLISKWSVTHHWVRRAEAYDADQQRRHLKAQAKAREEMAERHAKLASALQAKLAQRLQNLDPDTLSPRDIAYWLDITTKVERQARGEPDKHEISGPDGGPIQFEQLGETEQKERLQKLIAEANKRLERDEDE